jgi:hypothetical protein
MRFIQLSGLASRWVAGIEIRRYGLDPTCEVEKTRRNSDMN